MSGERRVDRKRRGLVVADLAHHDDIGVLAEERAQAIGEREPDVRPHLGLIDPRDAVLNRVFNRGDIDRRGIEHLQHGIERGGFTGAGRTGG